MKVMMMKMITAKRISITLGLIIAATLFIGLGLFFYTSLGEEISIPEGMKITTIVPTMDVPIPKKMNAIWTASFLSAWKTLQLNLVKEPISLESSPKIVKFLNNADDPRPYIPKEALYAIAGWNQEGIINQIQTDWQQRFPTQEPPTFPDILPNAFVMYAYLNARIKFGLPYFQNDEPLVFSDSRGSQTSVKSFGIRPKDELAYFELRHQPMLLSYKGGGCIVDLDHTSTPNQIVLAVIKREPTLAKMYESVQEKIESVEPNPHAFEAYGILLVPDILLHISHHFETIERHNFTNTKLKLKEAQGNVMQQDIQFRSDRGGAELKSEAKGYPMYAATSCYFDRPFLIYMKPRDAKMPYFVMWIDNAELLQKW